MFDRTYAREMSLWVAAMMIAFLAMLAIIRLLPQGSPLRAFALLPYALVIAGICWSVLRQLGRLDEMQRLIYLGATFAGSVAFMAFCALAFTGEMLHLWPRVAPIWGLAAMGAGYALGLAIARHRYAG